MLSIQNEWVRIPTHNRDIEGMLRLPADHLGIVLFAVDGGNRIKPLNDYLGSVLRAARLGTLWLNLSLPEDGAGGGAQDAAELAHRLERACDWLREQPATHDAPLLLFGASSAAALALRLAAARKTDIAAVVTRSARMDMATQAVLDKISAPTLMIVGSLDDGVVGANRSAYAALRCKKRLEVVPGATHLFDEPGSTEVVARLARCWFVRHAHFTVI